MCALQCRGSARLRGLRVSGPFPATRFAVLRLRRRAAAPRGLNTISVIVSQAAI